MRDVLIKADWLPAIKNAPEEVKKELFYRIIKYGCLEEENIDVSKDEWFLANSWETIKGNLDRMKDARTKSQEYGKKVGRKMICDPMMIYMYCQAHPNAKVNEVGEALNLPQRATNKGMYSYIYDNPGWKNRKAIDWHYEAENSENEEILSENIRNSEEFSEGNSENFLEGAANLF